MVDNLGDKSTTNLDRFESIVQNLTKCKLEFYKDREEIRKIREINKKLEVDLKETRELEKSHRYRLLTSREMIGNLQETVSQLVYLKRDVKKLKDEILLREKTIISFEKDKENLLMKNEISLEELRNNYEKEMEEMRTLNENKIHEIQHESDAKVAQYTCVIEELRSKIKDLEAEHREKVNVVVLEYEEKIQRGAAQIAQLQEQLAHQAARTDANIDAYRRRLEDLEEKLKQSQFKKYLAQSTYPSQYETQVERPYSVDRDRYTDTNSVEFDPVLETTRSNMTLSQNKASRTNTLQVMYYGQNNNKAKEKKGSFNITKKRKLYSEKDFQDM